MQRASNEIVSVIIVTSGREGSAGFCLDSIKNQTYKELEVIVIDNSLNQDFSRDIARRYPEVKLYSQAKNLFYAESLNKAIAVSKGDFALCLNDDVILDGRFIQEGLSGFYRDPSIGMVSGKVLRPNGIILDSTGLFLTLWRTAKERGYNRIDRGQYNRAEYIFGVNGAAAFYRRKMLEDIKVGCDYFDSDFRIFYEDLDIAWRANLFGWRAYYLPQAIAYHIRGGTIRKKTGINRPYARRYINHELQLDLIKNRHLSIVKNESIINFLLHLPFILFYDFIILNYSLFFRPLVFKKLFLNFKYLASAFKKRRAIQDRRRRVSLREGRNINHGEKIYEII